MTVFRSVLFSLLLFSLGAFLSVPSVQAQQCSFNGTLDVSASQLVTDSDPVQGASDADLLLVEFFDPNCPHCQNFKPVMDQVMETYGDQVRYYKQPVPLWQFSREQIRAMLIAKEKGKYYEMVDAQLESPYAGKGGLTTDQIVDLADDIGLDPDWMREKLASNAKQSGVNRLPYEARKAGIQSTPTLAIGDKIVANRSADCIGQLVEQELASSTEASTSSGGQ